LARRRIVRGPVARRWACSGGRDSLALAAAARFEGQRVGLVTVDHGLQAGSATRAAQVATWARSEHFDPVLVEPVRVGRSGGPEAAARTARYAALVAVAHRVGASGILLGHTRDDQAETVLLALARGAGSRGLSGMPASRTLDGVTLLRPLLDISRQQTSEACAALKLDPWDDPHNSDPAYGRARLRSAMPTLVDVLGPDVVSNLARTATLLAADSAVLDLLTDQATEAATRGGGLLIAVLAPLPTAVRTRVLHRWARSLGAPGSALSYRHVQALDALVIDWHGQGAAALPGGIHVIRRGDRLERARDIPN
jgi:tRNA(Ile)-lysidine synthase